MICFRVNFVYSLARNAVAKTLVIVLAALALAACQSTDALKNSKQAEQSRPSYSIYLAGPEVFLPNPIQAGKDKKAIIAELSEQNDWPFDLVGLYPMDNEIEDFAANFETGIKIYQANVELMQKADFVTANMVRFRGPSMDVGTAYEMGYMRGLDKPVFAYYDSQPFYGENEQAGIYADKVAKYYPLSPTDSHKDIHGQSIEDFKMADNLMMIGAINDTKVNDANKEIAISFEQAIKQIADFILNQNEE